MATLDLYHGKRDFSRTREPRGDDRRSTAGEARFVVQKHAARRLHYDLRLEHDGVLWSWAVTRGPSLDPSEKRLAVRVEDHPIEYARFEGTIPAGEYGGGAVIVWDEGRWQPEGAPEAGIAKGHLAFSLTGHKLAGKWHLVRLKGRGREKHENWLLIKADDDAARTDGDILADAPDSVVSGRSVEDVAAEEAAPGASAARPARAALVAKRRQTPSPAAGAKAASPSRPRQTAPMPGFVPPCLATLHAKPPEGAQWVHEIKFDGYRIQAHLDHGAVSLFTRTGLDWSERFGDAIPAALARLPVERAILDGEIVALGEDGIASFGALQAAVSEGEGQDAAHPLVYVAFDLLYLDGADLRDEPLAARHERLASVIEGAVSAEPHGAVRLSEQFVEPGAVMLAHTCRLGLEGVVSKRLDAPYRSGRSQSWLKAKCTQRQEFVIAGYVPSTASREAVGSLVVGYREGDRLVPAGRVGTGFTRRSAADLKRRLDAVKASRSPYEGKAARERGVVWVRPELVAEVEFASWTDGGAIRHAAYQGLREDKPAEEVVAERPETEEPPAAEAPAAGTRSSRRRSTTAEVPEPERPRARLTHPDKVLWPDCGLTKQGLLDYYAAAWPLMEPYVAGRPLSLVRAPDGIDGQRFFQKHASKGMSGAIHVTRDPKDGEELLSITDFDGLAALVQMGCLEIHLWGATVDDLERPDQLIFDLDPDTGVGLDALRDAASRIRDGLAAMGLTGFLKTSGGKGFHVCVPLAPEAAWNEVKDFAHGFARTLAEVDPKRFTATLSKKARVGRIFVDYLRNGRGATAVAPFSTRARRGATIAMPIPWDALETTEPAQFTVLGDGGRLAEATADAWRDWRKAAVPLPRT
jgi:bifunctional non-homologous end joining protein LigD